MFDFLLAPLVVALRIPVLVQEIQQIALGRTAGGNAESERMVTEKFAALNEGFLHASAELSRTHFELGRLAMQGRSLAFVLAAHGLPHRVMVAAVRPAHRRLRSNARRLVGR